MSSRRKVDAAAHARRFGVWQGQDLAWSVYSRDPREATRLGDAPRWHWIDAFDSFGEAIDAALERSQVGDVVRLEFSAQDPRDRDRDWEDSAVFPPYTPRASFVAWCEAIWFGPV